VCVTFLIFLLFHAGYEQPYEPPHYKYPATFAPPLHVLIQASNGASDYGNKFGEPVISGFAISYGLNSADDTRNEYVKPIMFSGGLGTMPASMREKLPPSTLSFMHHVRNVVSKLGPNKTPRSYTRVILSN